VERRESALFLVFKIVERLSQRWRSLNGGVNLMSLVLGGLRVQRRHPPAQGKLPDAGSRRLTTDQPGKGVSTTLDASSKFIADLLSV